MYGYAPPENFYEDYFTDYSPDDLKEYNRNEADDYEEDYSYWEEYEYEQDCECSYIEYNEY